MLQDASIHQMMTLLKPKNQPVFLPHDTQIEQTHLGMCEMVCKAFFFFFFASYFKILSVVKTQC